MNVLASRSTRVAAATLISFALVPLAVADRLSARLTGEEYLLDVEPVDPIDPFRGAYVALGYPGLPNDQQLTEPRMHGEDVYIPLTRSGDVWAGLRPVSERPDSGPYLRCKDEHWQLRCGIESWFLPQDKAYALEQGLNQGRALARVRIDSHGNAALVAVEILED